ncbi:hypothetical protein K438DRAFT_1976723 [Mycena galopus ATCC 62051]|nr:hypothetical protein K438DRAFT_1976723 [Mycena galopus ATCC 62051]
MYLVEYHIDTLPPPGALLVLSPWADLGTSHDTPGSSPTTCRASDMLVPPAVGPPSNLLHYPLCTFTDPLGLGAAKWNEYILPVSKHIADTDHMKCDMGTRVQYLEAAGSVHDFLLLPELQEPQRRETFTMIAEWMKED